METSHLPALVSLGLKPSPALNTTYTVGVGQTLFSKQSHGRGAAGERSAASPGQEQGGQDKLDDSEFDYDIEYSTEHVPLGEILDRLQSEDRGFEAGSDKSSNLIRLHAVNDSNAATISATLNFATLDLSAQSNLHHHLTEINDVLFSINKDDGGPGSPLAPPLSPLPVPDQSHALCLASPASSEESTAAGLLPPLSCPALSPTHSLNHGYETRTSPQECNLCNKMFGNASALAKHRLTHSDERKYLCNVCHKAFKRQDHLNGHLLTHRNKKPFECMAPACNKSYCDARSLRRHRENHHSGGGGLGRECSGGLVSPASSVASSTDTDDKSLGSESCDGSTKGRETSGNPAEYTEPEVNIGAECSTDFQQVSHTFLDSQSAIRSPIASGTKLVFTGINSLDKEKLRLSADSRQFQLIEQIIRETKESEAATHSPVKLAAAAVPPAAVSRAPAFPVLGLAGVGRTGRAASKPEPDPSQNMVECSICSRKFKNIPALNGHMRLHGGYYRKDNDKHKASEQKAVAAPPEPLTVSTHTVSSNVRALIEEKIIQKRKLEPTVLRLNPVYPAPTSLSLPCSTATSLCSTYKSVKTPAEPPAKRFALQNNNKSISSLDNLVFPVLPQPDTSALLAALASKQPALAALLPSAPLPNINNIKDTQVNKAHQHSTKLLKIQRTDFQPSVGQEFQAILPEYRTSCEDTKYGVVGQETLMWSPTSAITDQFSQSQLDAFLRLASSSAVREGGNNTETALLLLLQCRGDILAASQALLSTSHKQERRGAWSAEEVDMFYEALCKHKKDFAKIAGDLPNQSTKDCVEFYYLWKNICREESQSFKSIINTNSDSDSDLLSI